MINAGRREFIASTMSAMLLPAPARAAEFRRASDTLGPRFETRRTRRPPRPNPATGLTDAVSRWNSIAIDCSGLDHTPPAAGESRVFAEQLGPCRASRAMAIVHLAIFRAASVGVLVRGAAAQIAVVQAAHDTLVSLFPAQSQALHSLLEDDLNAVSDAAALRRGVVLGRLNAAGVLAARRNDGSEAAGPKVGIEHVTSDEPGHWRQDPIGRSPLAMGAYWAAVRPFTMRAVEQFRVEPPPAMASDAYAIAFNEVRQLGGDGVATSTTRSSEQTAIGIYWGL